MGDFRELEAEARACYAAGDLEGACERYARLLRERPDDADLLNDIGTVCFALGRLRESRDHLLRALRRSPGHPDAARNLQMVRRSLGLPLDCAGEATAAPQDGPRAGRDVSVVVPVHSGLDALDRCLDALHGQAFPAERFEVVLAANGMDGERSAELRALTDRWRRHFGERLRSLELEEASIAAARNAGVREACGRLVLQINEDTILGRRALAEHHAEHERLGFDPRCVVVGGRRFPDSYLTGLFNYLHEAIPLYTPLHRVRPSFLGDSTWFITCNLSCAREAYERFGLYDPSFAWGSDQQLGRRWEREHGVRIYVNTGIVGYHLHRITFDAWRRKCIAAAPHWFRRNMGIPVEELPPEGRDAVREELDSMRLNPADVEAELRRLEGNFRGPDRFAGDTVMGQPALTVEVLIHRLRPLLRDYRKHLQYWEIWKRISESEPAAA